MARTDTAAIRRLVLGIALLGGLACSEPETRGSSDPGSQSTSAESSRLGDAGRNHSGNQNPISHDDAGFQRGSASNDEAPPVEGCDEDAYCHPCDDPTLSCAVTEHFTCRCDGTTWRCFRIDEQCPTSAPARDSSCPFANQDAVVCQYEELGGPYPATTLQAQGVAGCAVVALRVSSGQVIALVGSPDFRARAAGQLNAALALRQPGSALKPFVYALAFGR